MEDKTGIPDTYNLPEGFDARYPGEVLVEDETAEKWHTGSYSKIARPQKCVVCGGNKFEIAVADYWTGVKCPTCGYEICIHEG